MSRGVRRVVGTRLATALEEGRARAEAARVAAREGWDTRRLTDSSTTPTPHRSPAAATAAAVRLLAGLCLSVARACAASFHGLEAADHAPPPKLEGITEVIDLDEGDTEYEDAE